MAKPCSICQHPNVQEIDSCLDSGEFKKNIAAQFSVSVHALSRHGRGLCRTDALDQEEEKWSARLEKTFQQAVTDQDVRGQQQVATTALRHVRARKAEKAKAVAAKQDADSGDDRISIGSLDEIVAILSQEHPSPVDRSKIAEVLRRSRELSRPDFVTMFHKAWEDSQFAEALSSFAATWEPELAQKGSSDEPVQQQETRATAAEADRVQVGTTCRPSL